MIVKVSRIQALALVMTRLGLIDTPSAREVIDGFMTRLVKGYAEDTLSGRDEFLTRLGCKLQAKKNGAVVSYFLVGYSADGSDITKALSDITNTGLDRTKYSYTLRQWFNYGCENYELTLELGKARCAPNEFLTR